MDIFFREKFWSGVDNGVKIPKCLQNIPTALIISLQYEIMAYLYIEHKITGFSKLT